jgi:ethanolamine utilization protein EutA
MLSVGIDVGTTTTQIVFSRLELADAARAGQIPRIQISDKTILYQSPIHFTPLAGHEQIDVPGLIDLVRREYREAGVEAGQVETGAVIITGETAKKRNADEILQALGGMAGEFVVTVAGPNLESMIAGRGSGAAEYSQKHFSRVTNVDIGGGSANSALFDTGKLISAAAMNYGGRILEIDHASGAVTHIAQPARAILENIGLRLQPGDTPGLADLRRFTGCMADLTLELIEGGQSPLAGQLYLTPPGPVSGKGTALMFSGGIGLYYYNPLAIYTVKDATIHNDVGPLLAESLRNHPALSGYEIARPAEMMRATVLGASSQTVSLSGSTIWAEREILPLRNLPVIRPVFADSQTLLSQPEAVAGAIQHALRRWDINTLSDNFAVAVDFNHQFDYNSLNAFADSLVHFASQELPASHPLIVIIERDYAQALGQTIKGKDPRRPLLVIDQVGLEEGDYIDIGAPVLDGRVVPVSVKTLIFYH